MEVSIIPAIISTEVLSDLPNGYASVKYPSFRVTVRVATHEVSLPFDAMLLRLHESVETQVGQRWAKQEVLSLSKECRSINFTPQEKVDPTDKHFEATVYFVDDKLVSEFTGADGPAILPSLSLSGRALVTRHTAISDRTWQIGSCKTRLWTSAAFYRGGHRVYYSETPFEWTCSPSAVKLASTERAPYRDLEINTPTRTSRLNLGKVNATGNIRIKVAEEDLQQPIKQSPGSGKGLILPVNLMLEEEASNLVRDDGSLGAEVSAKWTRRIIFTASQLNAASPITGDNGAVAKQTSFVRTARLDLPPCYDRTHGLQPRISGFLHVPVPDEIDIPTFQSSLLSIKYELGLTISFHPPLNKPGLATTSRARASCHFV